MKPEDHDVAYLLLKTELKIGREIFMKKFFMFAGPVLVILAIAFIALGSFCTYENRKTAKLMSTGIGELINLKMEYAYKQGQVDALHGLIKIKISTNDSNQEVWEWAGSPWDGVLKPHSPALVDAQNDADIVDKLRGEK